MLFSGNEGSDKIKRQQVTEEKFDQEKERNTFISLLTHFKNSVFDQDISGAQIVSQSHLLPNDNSQIKNEEKWLVFEQKCSKLNLIELRARDDFGQTLLHFSAGLDNTDLLNVLLTVDGDLTKYTNKLGKSAGDEALKHGQWSVVKYNV